MKQKYGLLLPLLIYTLGIVSYYIMLIIIQGDISVFSGIFIALACLIGGKYIDKKAHIGGLILLFVLLLGSGIMSLAYKETTEVENVFAWFNVMSGVEYVSVSANIIMLFVSSTVPVALLLLSSKLSKKTVEIENLASISQRIIAGVMTAVLMIALIFGGMGVVFICSTDRFDRLINPDYRNESNVFEHEDDDGVIYLAIQTSDNNQYATEIVETPFFFIKNTNRYISCGSMSADDFHFAVDNIVRDNQLKYLVVFSSNVSNIARFDYKLGNDEQKTIIIDKNEPFAEFIAVTPDMCDRDNKMNYSFYAYDENGDLVDDYISATYVY